MTIPAITLHQPWAMFVALGAKRIETRSWRPVPTKLMIGELLAIHAGEQPVRGNVWHLCCDRRLPGGLTNHIHETLRAHSLGPLDLPLGAVVCIACYRGAYDTGMPNHISPWVQRLPEQELALGNFAPHRYGWHTELLLRLPEPIPARGAQGIWRWDVPPEVEAMLKEVVVR